MDTLKVSVFLLPQKPTLPLVNLTETDVEKDPAYHRIVRQIEKNVLDASNRKQKKCDVSIDVETHKIPPIKRLLEKKGYSVFVQGVYV